MVNVKRFWWVIAGMLLLASSPALAESFLRVNKQGVIYYYFNNRETAAPRQQGLKTAATPGDVWAPEASRPLPGKAPLKLKTQDILAANPAPVLPPLWQVLPTPGRPSSSSAPASPAIQGVLTSLRFFDPPEIFVCPPVASDPEMEPEEVEPPDPGILVAPAREPGGTPAAPRSVFLFPVSYKQGVTQAVACGQRQQPALCLRTVGQQVYSFPVAWPFTFRDTWGDPRSGGRFHQAVDIAAPEGAGVYAITSGVIQVLGTFNRAGITIFMRGSDGRGYSYMHLQGYAPGLVEGKAVQAGELIGYVGRTGVFESGAHLHFEVYANPSFSKDSYLNPYTFLVQLCRGHGVSDLNQPRLPRLIPPLARVNQPRAIPGKIKWLQGYRQPWSEAYSAQTAHKPPVLDIKHFWE